MKVAQAYSASGARLRKRKLFVPSDPASFYSCKEAMDIIRIRPLFSGYESDMVKPLWTSQPISQSTSPPPYFKIPPSNFSSDSISVYSSKDTVDPILKRTRAKTPVFAIGQLENSLQRHSHDAIEILAEKYRALLPPRCETPFAEAPYRITPRKTPRKTLRKTKKQQNLRDLVNSQSRASSISDSETLVGSEPPSPRSPTCLQTQLENFTFQDISGWKHNTIAWSGFEIHPALR